MIYSYNVFTIPGFACREVPVFLDSRFCVSGPSVNTYKVFLIPGFCRLHCARKLGCETVKQPVRQSADQLPDLASGQLGQLKGKEGAPQAKKDDSAEVIPVQYRYRHANLSKAQK